MEVDVCNQSIAAPEPEPVSVMRSLLGPDVRIRRFQGLDHHLGGDQIRVIGHGVDLPAVLEPPGYFMDAGQPFQDCFADVVSAHVKDNPGVVRGRGIPGNSRAEPRRRQHKEHCEND